MFSFPDKEEGNIRGRERERAIQKKRERERKHDMRLGGEENGEDLELVCQWGRI